MNSSKQTIGAKISSREGKSPDHQLRSLNIMKWKKREISENH